MADNYLEYQAENIEKQRLKREQQRKARLKKAIEAYKKKHGIK